MAEELYLQCFGNVEGSLAFLQGCFLPDLNRLILSGFRGLKSKNLVFGAIQRVDFLNENSKKSS